MHCKAIYYRFSFTSVALSLFFFVCSCILLCITSILVAGKYALRIYILHFEMLPVTRTTGNRKFIGSHRPVWYEIQYNFILSETHAKFYILLHIIYVLLPVFTV